MKISFVLCLAILGCSGDDDPDGGGGGGPCNAVVSQHATQGQMHVDVGTLVSYNSNPPSSGPHYPPPMWAMWGQVYDAPVPRGAYVHNLEHGGVVLLYHCTEACPDIVSGLMTVASAIQDTCTPPRWLISPDNMLDPGVKVAAATWQWTYTADCVDADTLGAFIADHLGAAPEDVCGGGIDYP